MTHQKHGNQQQQTIDNDEYDVGFLTRWYKQFPSGHR